MALSAPPASPLGSPNASTADELEARLYQALQRGDLETLMSLWADEDEVVCVHPGGPRALGLAAIRTSFAQIFANGGIPVRPEQVSKLQWPGGAVHHLVERIDIDTPQGKQVVWVLATNVYVKGVRGWQVVAHHASPAAPGELALGSMGRDGPSALH